MSMKKRSSIFFGGAVLTMSACRAAQISTAIQFPTNSYHDQLGRTQITPLAAAVFILNIVGYDIMELVKHAST